MAAPLTATRAGLQVCPGCAKVHPLSRQGACDRCGATLHWRKPHSLQRAWAWLLTGLILYVPANLYPIMATELLGQRTQSTILGGVVVLYEHHAYLVAVVIFVASILIPLTKFIIMGYLLLSIQRRSLHQQGNRHRLYHWVEFVGRWSMIDIFVVAILGALVQFGHFAQVLPGVGAGAFAAVVVSTMFAATSLDPRLLWDSTDVA